MGKKLFARAAIIMGCLMLSFAAAETYCRVILADRLAFDERNLIYRHDENLGWFPMANYRGSFKGSRAFSVNHNGRGFRDGEHVIRDKERMVVLGDSFVWGYDVEQSERFTDKLQESIPDWSVANLGVSGYGTDQEYLLLRNHFDYYRPRIVLLVFDDNDEADNASNLRYGGYYKPYFTLHQGELELRGVPVPKSMNYYLSRSGLLERSCFFRAAIRKYYQVKERLRPRPEYVTMAVIDRMRRFVEDRKAVFIVALATRHRALEEFLARENIPFVDVSNSYTYPGHGQHWTPGGHIFVHNRVLESLREGGYLDLQ